MKLIRTILTPKLILLRTILLAGLLFNMTSCGNNQKPEDTKDMAEKSNDEKFDNKKEDDAEFLVKAAATNLEEIQLGQLAQESAVLTDVKALGKMMEQAHTKAQEALVALAAKKAVTVPTSPTDDAKKAYENMTNKTGIKFDKEYCSMMVDGHKKAIEMFEKASKNANDPEIREWATNTLPELNMHLEHAQKCKKMCEKM